MCMHANLKRHTGVYSYLIAVSHIYIRKEYFINQKKNRDFKKGKKVVGRTLQYFLTIFSLLRHSQNASETS